MWLALLAASTGAIAVPTFEVNSTADGVDDNVGDGICHTTAGTCTLRAAVMSANHASGAGVQIDVPAGTYTLVIPAAGSDGEETGDLNVTAAVPIVIAGAGRNATLIDANQIDRVLGTSADATLTLSGLGLKNGFSDTRAGAVDNLGRLSLVDVDVTDSAGFAAGCLRNNSAGTLSLLRVTVERCHSDTGPGGIYNDRGTLHVVDSTLRRNSGDFGGGLRSSGSTAVVELRNATLSENTAGAPTVAQSGGGAEINGGAFTAINSSIVGNSAYGYGGGIRFTGGFEQSYSGVNFYDTTIAYNSADLDEDGFGVGGGLFIASNITASVNLYNSLLAGNYRGTSPVPDDCAGVVSTHARNLFGDVGGCTIHEVSGSWDLLNSVDLLGGLADNGGPTKTVALLPGSNAIDGNPAGCVGPGSVPVVTDQRGAPRPNGADCDIGAYERTDSIFRNGFDG